MTQRIYYITHEYYMNRGRGDFGNSVLRPYGTVGRKSRYDVEVLEYV